MPLRSYGEVWGLRWVLTCVPGYKMLKVVGLGLWGLGPTLWSGLRAFASLEPADHG